MGPLRTWPAMPLSWGCIMPDPLPPPPFIYTHQARAAPCWALCFHKLLGGHLFC